MIPFSTVVGILLCWLRQANYSVTSGAPWLTASSSRGYGSWVIGISLVWCWPHARPLMRTTCKVPLFTFFCHEDDSATSSLLQQDVTGRSPTLPTQLTHATLARFTGQTEMLNGYACIGIQMVHQRDTLLTLITDSVGLVSIYSGPESVPRLVLALIKWVLGSFLR